MQFATRLPFLSDVAETVIASERAYEYFIWAVQGRLLPVPIPKRGEGGLQLSGVRGSATLIDARLAPEAAPDVIH